MDLIDLSQLKICSERVGFEIYETSDDVPSQSFPICKHLEVDEIIRRRETNQMVSHPKSSREVIQLSEHEIQPQPAYFLTYSVDRDFITSTGRIIHSIQLSDVPLLLDGRNGELYPSLAEFFKECEKIPLENVKRLGLSRIPYLLSENEVKKRAVEELVKRHTTKVVYYAGKRGGRRYKKICSPSRGDIKMIYIEKVYVPKWGLKYTALKTSYSVVACAKPNDLLLLQNDFEKCATCNKIIKSEKRVLCNDCGKIGHAGFFTKHSFSCKNCKKTLCKSCAIERREWFILKRRYCGECYEKFKLFNKNL